MNEAITMTAEGAIRVNGRSEPLGAGTLAALLVARDIEPGGRGLAIAVNGAVVPRAGWAQVRLSPGDTVEIVQAKQGG
jgi:sulfur carrier protein